MFQGRSRHVPEGGTRMTGDLRFTSSSVFREEPEGGILFDVDTGKLKLVEGVAWGICALIDRGASRKSILRELASRYPDEMNLESDLDSFLGILALEGFLVPRAHGGNPDCS
jgi:hypothetical protein